MKEIVKFSDIVEENGKTIKENNLAKNHELQLGQIVNFDFKSKHDKFTIHTQGELYIVGLTRDCDGTPLYILSDIPVEYPMTGSFSREVLLYNTISETVQLHFPYKENDNTGIIGIISGPQKIYKSISDWFNADG